MKLLYFFAPILIGACEYNTPDLFDDQRHRSHIVFYILINHSKIMNDLSVGQGAYLDSLVYELKGDGDFSGSIDKIQILAKANTDPVDFAKSTIKAFKCCSDLL